MRIDRRLLDWGVFFVLSGLSCWPSSRAGSADIRWWQLWPLLLIGIGVTILLRRTAVAAIGGVVVAGTFGLIIGGALANSAGGFPAFGVGCIGGSDAGTAFPTQDGALVGDRATVRLEMGCGDLDVTTESGSAWSLSGTADDGRLPHVDRSAGELTIRDIDEGASNFFRDRSRWDVVLPTEPTLDLTATVNAGKSRIDLAGANLGVVSASINAGDGRLDLGGASASHLSVDVNAGSATILLPDGSLSGSLTVTPARSSSARHPTSPFASGRATTSRPATTTARPASPRSATTWESSDWTTATNASS
jgi:hypothetical protein